jgi:MYXO-CTERM domain-containing protein
VSSAPASPLMPWAVLGLLSLASLRRRARTSRSFSRRPI